MKKIRVCVVGYGNVGKEAVECIRPVSYTHLDVYKRQPALVFRMIYGMLDTLRG